MKAQNFQFDEYKALHNLKHYLPVQAPLKDFIHRDKIQAYTTLKSEKGIYNSSTINYYNIS